MDKQHILNEIRRTARDGGRAPLGRQAFERETGIKMSDWWGRYWANWGDALREAGFQPNSFQAAYDEADVIKHLVLLVRELGHFPTEGEQRMAARGRPGFPSHSTFRRLGSRDQLLEKVRAYCASHAGYEDVLSVCPAARVSPSRAMSASASDDVEVLIGFVYLIKSGRYYKIGRTNAVGRREREIALQLPEAARTVHEISTDDPAGIEAYWHKRFEAKRMNGEWFELTPLDVKAFRRRKFM